MRQNDTTISQNYYGFYRGIVIDNADPDSRGRVKVFLPEFATSIISNVGLPDDIDYEVKFVGTNPLLSGDALEYAKRVCKWAEQASPLVGSGSAGNLAGGKHPTVADGPAPSSVTPITIATAAKGANGAKGAKGAKGQSGPTGERVIVESDLPSGEPDFTRVPDVALKLFGDDPIIDFATLSAKSVASRIAAPINGEITVDGVSIPPAAPRELVGGKSNGKFSDVRTGRNVVSPLNNSLSPTSYPNATKGLFSVPNIGANVWVFFENNNPNCPVYFAYMYDQNDWGNIQNISKTSNGANYPRDGKDNVLRNKIVLNSRGGNIEIVDTQGAEKIKMSSYSGSTLELGNLSNIEIAAGNKDTIVSKDLFLTIKGTRNISTDKNSDENVDGDRYLKVGKQDQVTLDKYKEWSKIDNQLAFINASPNLLPTINLPNPSIISKDITLFPTTQEAIESLPKVNNEAASLVLNFFDIKIPEVKINVPVGVKLEPALSLSSQGATAIPSPKIAAIDGITQLLSSKLSSIEKEFGEGGSEIIQIAKHKTEIVGAVNNLRDSVRIIESGRSEIQRVSLDSYGSYPKYAPFQHVEPVAQLPFPCGTKSTTASKYSLIVGSGGVEIKTIGVLNISSKITTIAGSEELNLSSNHSVNIRGKCIVIGSSEGEEGGDSNGNALVLRNADQVVVDSNLGVSRNVVVGGGMSIEGNLCVRSVSAPVELQKTESIETFGETVPGKAIGWCQVDGVYITVYGGTVIGESINSLSAPNSIKIYTHNHNFRNLPLTLHESIIGIPDADEFNDSSLIVTANPVEHGMKDIVSESTIAQ